MIIFFDNVFKNDFVLRIKSDVSGIDYVEDVKLQVFPADYVEENVPVHSLSFIKSSITLVRASFANLYDSVESSFI